MDTKPLEADTRLLIDNNLKNLGWILSGKDQNVFFERPKTINEQKKLKGKRPDYVLYSKEDGMPLIVIEAKKKGERIDTALEQGIYYAKQLEAPLVYATDGVFCKSFHVGENKVPQLNGEDVDEFIREALAMKFLASWEVNTVSPKVQYDRKELIKIFDEANNMLRGDGLRAGIERFGEFSNILFLKLISETEDRKKLSGIQTEFNDMCHWDYIKSLKSDSRIEHINKIVNDKLNSLYGTDIFTPLLIKDSTILKDIIDKLDPLTLTDVDSDIKGDAFEYFLKESTSTKNDLGEYFTPRHIVKTMVRLLNPQIGEKIYDPFCGTGGFLIESFRHIYNTMPRNSVTEEMLRKETIYGNEITNTARITKMNMILAGDGHSNINMRDSLANPINREYDVVIANMPYSQKTKYGNLYDLASKNGDSVCVQHCMKAISSLAENGRMALVVPEGFLFRKDLSKTREYLLENSQLQSIISLPQGVFLPYTGVKTNIIYATKVNQKLKAKDKRKDFWYFNVKSDGYTLDNHRRRTEKSNDLSKYEEYRKLDREQVDEMLEVGFEKIPFEKVKDNFFILAGNRYREQKIDIGEYPIVELGRILNYEQPTSYIVKNTNYSDEFHTPVLTAGQSFVLGYTDETEGVFDSKLPVIIFDDFTTAIKLVDFPFKVKSSALKILKINSKLANIKYVYYAMHGLKFDSSTHKRYWIEEYSKLFIPLPPLNVQNTIVDELVSYEKIINSAKLLLENYKPHITIDPKWKREKLEDVCDVRDGTHDSPQYVNEGYPLVTSKNVKFGGINFEGVNYINEIDFNNINKRSKVDTGDIIMPMIGTIGNPVIVNTNKLFAIKNLALIKFYKNKEKILNRYVQLCLMSKDFEDYIEPLKRGNTQKFISLGDIRSYPIPVPDLEIQKQIVDQIEIEESLIEPSKKIIEVFTKKSRDKIKKIYK